MPPGHQPRISTGRATCLHAAGEETSPHITFADLALWFLADKLLSDHHVFPVFIKLCSTSVYNAGENGI